MVQRFGGTSHKQMALVSEKGKERHGLVFCCPDAYKHPSCQTLFTQTKWAVECTNATTVRWELMASLAACPAASISLLLWEGEGRTMAWPITGSVPPNVQRLAHRLPRSGRRGWHGVGRQRSPLRTFLRRRAMSVVLQ